MNQIKKSQKSAKQASKIKIEADNAPEMLDVIDPNSLSIVQRIVDDFVYWGPRLRDEESKAFEHTRSALMTAKSSKQTC